MTGEIERFELPEPAPMLPPVPAVVLGVKGDAEVPDELSVVWTFVLNGTPPQVGVSVAGPGEGGGKGQVALPYLETHGEFTLNVPDASWVEAFDVIDMASSEKADKFARAGLARLPSKTVGAPGVAQAPVVLECRVFDARPLRPARRVFFAEVLRTTVRPGVTDASGRLDPGGAAFFGMASGCGEFRALGKKVGHIGMSKGSDRIRY
jgi:flavin reductase (DIM6/NTAB) family NADH-FMN oxidoreductase RutF